MSGKGTTGGEVEDWEMLKHFSLHQITHFSPTAFEMFGRDKILWLWADVLIQMRALGPQATYPVLLRAAQKDKFYQA